jgi:hypothetical protein
MAQEPDANTGELGAPRAHSCWACQIDWVPLPGAVSAIRAFCRLGPDSAHLLLEKLLIYLAISAAPRRVVSRDWAPATTPMHSVGACSSTPLLCPSAHSTSDFARSQFAVSTGFDRCAEFDRQVPHEAMVGRGPFWMKGFPSGGADDRPTFSLSRPVRICERGAGPQLGAGVYGAGTGTSARLRSGSRG